MPYPAKTYEPRYNDPDWLNERETLFAKYCLPSVQAQTLRDFEWIMMIDAGLPNKNRIWMTEQDERIHLLEVDYSNFKDRLRDHVRCEGILCTSRIDSDDAIRADYLESVRDTRGTMPVCVEYPDGLRYDVRTRKMRRHHYLGNPFQSMVELGDNPLTCHAGGHGGLHRKAERRDFLPSLGWMQIIHGGNLRNDDAGGARVTRSDIGDFPLAQELLGA
jgi:hypothetical protein